MLESSVYSESDLRPFQSRIAELRQVVKDDAKNQPPAMIQLIERKLTQCGECFHFTLVPCIHSRSFNFLLLESFETDICESLRYATI